MPGQLSLRSMGDLFLKAWETHSYLSEDETGHLGPLHSWGQPSSQAPALVSERSKKGVWVSAQDHLWRMNTPRIAKLQDSSVSPGPPVGMDLGMACSGEQLTFMYHILCARHMDLSQTCYHHSMCL
jgi:hypothetical protein